MKPKQFDNLPHEGDNAVVTLMTDPDGDEDSMFVSLVHRGANQRRIAVAKTEGSTIDSGANPLNVDPDLDEDDDTDDGEKAQKVDDLQSTLEVTLDLGQERGEPWWRRMFSSLMGLMPSSFSNNVTGVSKSSTEFDANLLADELWPRLWQATDILFDTVAAIMMDEDIPSKQEAIDRALNQFSRFVSDQFLSVPVIKGEELTRSAKMIADRALDHRRHVIKGADLATIGRARDILAQLDLPSTPPAAVAAQPEDDSMNLEQLAQKAAEHAVKAAKAANPSITATELANIASNASVEVFKAAFKGPKQPAMPQNALQTQVNMSQGVSGSTKDPNAAFTATLNKISDTVKKMEELLQGAGDDTPGLLQVVAKQGEALSKIGERVQKMERTPQPSNAGGEEPGRTKAAKADVSFENTALGGFGV